MIQDNSYDTYRHGRVRSYSGYELTGDPGARVLRVGYPPSGGPDYLRCHGGIVEHREDSLGTAEFERRLGRSRYAAGELEYADYVATQLANGDK